MFLEDGVVSRTKSSSFSIRTLIKFYTRIYQLGDFWHDRHETTRFNKARRFIDYKISLCYASRFVRAINVRSKIERTRIFQEMQLWNFMVIQWLLLLFSLSQLRTIAVPLFFYYDAIFGRKLQFSNQSLGPVFCRLLAVKQSLFERTFVSVAFMVRIAQ